MNNIIEYLKSYLYFGVIFAIFLVILVIIILIWNKKGSSKSIYLYGLFMDYKNNQVLALTLILMNFLLMIYTLIMKINLTVAYSIISILLVLISFLVLKRYKYLLINSGINFINIGLIYFANLVNTLRIDNPGALYLTLQILVNVFGLFFYMFSTFKFILNIRGKELKHEK